MSKKLITVFISLGIVLLNTIWSEHNYSKDFTMLGVGILLTYFIEILEFMYKNRGKLKLLFQSLIQWNTTLRLSFAYLLKIRVDGEYLLIYNSKFEGFQPVGGVYKFFDKTILTTLGLAPDDNIPWDNDKVKNDLRVRQNQSKYLYKFLTWFEKKEGRETDPKREFYEEMIESKILPLETFININYQFSHKHYDGIKQSEKFPGKELIYADVYEVHLTDEQKIALRELKKNPPKNIMFVSKNDIELDHQANNFILPHTKKLFL